MRCSWSDRVKEWRSGDAGGLERNMSLFLSSSSSTSLQSAPDRRSLIGNEPWSHMLSRDQQIATTYRLWRGDSSLSHLHLSITPLSPLSLHLSLHVFMGSLGFIRGSVAVRATGNRGVFYCSWFVKRPTYSIPTWPALKCQYWPIHLEWPPSHHCMCVTAFSHTLVNDQM